MLRILSPLCLRCALFTLLLVMAGCASTHQLDVSELSDNRQRGDAIALEKVGGYSSFLAKAIVWIAGMSDRVPVSYGVDLYRLTYLTLDENGELAEATGLLTIPRSESAIGVLSWQHGTAVTRSLVPSAPTPDEGVLASLAFAGHGYILLAPDYIGLGGSVLNHPYYHADTAAANVRDMVIAAHSVITESTLAWPEKFFLTGFSQGGFNTMVALRDQEAQPIPNVQLTAAASIAGPFDLAGFSFLNALKGESPSASLYLAYIINTYSRVYDMQLDSVLREPYASTVPDVFNGELDSDAVAEALPQDPRELFLDSVLAELDAGNLGWIGTRLRENSLGSWSPKTPVRLYYGNADTDVSPLEAINQVSRWDEMGLSVIAEDVGAFDHNESVIEAAPRIRNWFDEFLN